MAGGGGVFGNSAFGSSAGGAGVWGNSGGGGGGAGSLGAGVGGGGGGNAGGAPSFGFGFGAAPGGAEGGWKSWAQPAFAPAAPAGPGAASSGSLFGAASQQGGGGSGTLPSGLPASAFGGARSAAGAEVDASQITRLNHENLDGFLRGARVLKAILFTKKSDTPAVWSKLFEQFGAQVLFGVVGCHLVDLVSKFGLREEELPKVLVIHPTGERVTYQGVSNFDRISVFINQQILRASSPSSAAAAVGSIGGASGGVSVSGMFGQGATAPESARVGVAQNAAASTSVKVGVGSLFGALGAGAGVATALPSSSLFSGVCACLRERVSWSVFLCVYIRGGWMAGWMGGWVSGVCMYTQVHMCAR